MTALSYRRTAPSDRPIVRRKVRIQRVRMGGLDWLALLLLASLVLLFDSLVIARHLGLVRLPGELTEVDLARSGAMAYVELQRGFLASSEVGGLGSAAGIIESAAPRFAAAKTRDDVGRELSCVSSEIMQAVQSDRACAAKKRIAALLESDSRVAEYRGQGAYILITPQGTESKVQDRGGALSRATIDAIVADTVVARSPVAIEVQVEEGQISFDTGDPVARAKALSKEIDSLGASTASLRVTSGLSELDGAGVSIAAYDAPSGYAWDEIVHQKDVLEVLDALFAAGALGAQVGGERIVATSSVRCIGPIVLVNQQPVPVNPIRIYAVGNQAALSKAVQPIAARFSGTGKRLEVNREAVVHLAPYHKGGIQW